MTPFEFFFTFYGLVLGLSVVELVAGAGRMVDEGHRLRVGWLTPLLAAFLGLDIATFWLQSWLLHQQAPFSYLLLVLALVTAGLFYVSAYLAFPRQLEDGAALDDHYWRRRRLILLGVALANLINGALLLGLRVASGDGLGAGIWLEIVPFFSLILLAALLPRGRWAALALVLLVGLALLDVAEDAVRLGQQWPWSLGPAGAGG